MKRIIICLFLTSIATGILSAQEITDIHKKFDAKVVFPDKKWKKGLLYAIDDSTVSIFEPLRLARKSVREGRFVQGVSLKTYKLSDLEAIQLLRRNHFAGLLRGAPTSFAASFLIAVAATNNVKEGTDGLLVAIGIMFIGTVVGTITSVFVWNGVKFFDTRKFGDSSLDEYDIAKIQQFQRSALGIE